MNEHKYHFTCDKCDAEVATHEAHPPKGWLQLMICETATEAFGKLRGSSIDYCGTCAPAIEGALGLFVVVRKREQAAEAALKRYAERTNPDA